MTSNLREQKRRATLAAIEEHATLLVAEHGYQHVTVEDICAAAHISRRTFFNYFESKEEAVFGSFPVLRTDDADAFLNEQHEDLTAELLEFSYRIFLGRIAQGDDSAAILRRRKAIMRAHPEFSTSRMAAFALIHDGLVRTTACYLERHDDARLLPHLAQVDEARIHVATVHAAIQIGVKQWTSIPTARLDDLHDYCAAALGNFRQLARCMGGENL